MKKEDIKALALTLGFKLKPQLDGSMDLNPYVYHFAMALLAAAPTPPALQLKAFDAGILNTFGGGDRDWWLDYIRNLLSDAHAHYQEQVTTTPPAPEVAIPDDFIGSVKRLVFIARISGGTAGRDRDLCAALSRVEAMLEAIHDPDWQKGMRQGVAPEVEPVAWMHDGETRVDIAHVAVKELWLKVAPTRVEHYTIPLYTHPADDGLRKAAEEVIKAWDSPGRWDMLSKFIENLRAELNKDKSC